MRLATWLLSSLLAAPAILWGHPEQPPPAHTGAFAEPDCGTCHFGAEQESGQLTLTTINGGWRPTETHELTLTLSGDSPVAGFQLTVRDDSGAAAGELLAGDPDTRVVAHGGVAYLGHAPARRRDGAGELAWSFQWRAPGVHTGPLRFTAVAVAANDDQSPLGDEILRLDAVIEAAP